MPTKVAAHFWRSVALRLRGVDPMSDLLMPKLGLTMTEGLVADWHVAQGASVVAGQTLLTVETEKVAHEIEAESDGVLTEILVAAGESVAVGTVVARIRAPGDAPENRPPPQDGPAARKLMREHALDRTDVPATGRDGRVTKGDVLRVIATPLARRVAQAQGVDLQTVTGSGPHGRIKAADLNDATARVVSVPETAQPRASGSALITPDAARLATARRVTAAKRDIPDFHLSQDADITDLLALREQLNADADRPRVTVTHMLVRALGLALTRQPQMNRIWIDGQIMAFDSADIGLVTETPDGLRIPVIRDAGGADLDSIAAQARDLAGRARDATLQAADVGGGAIALSNVGMFGARSLTPIISPPNAMILGVGADAAVFRPDDTGAPVLRRELLLTLVCDHRLIDGGAAARFLAQVVALLQSPLSLLRPAN